MKTWQMIKELTENPEKEFIRKSDGLHIKTNEHGELVWDSGYQFLKLHHNWEEVRKPISFIELLENVKDNGDFSEIDVEHSLTKRGFEKCNLFYILRKVAEECENDSELAQSLLEAEWYIED